MKCKGTDQEVQNDFGPDQLADHEHKERADSSRCSDRPAGEGSGECKSDQAGQSQTRRSMMMRRDSSRV